MTPLDYKPPSKMVQKKRTICHMANSALAYVNAYVINYDIKYSSFLAKKQSFLHTAVLQSNIKNTPFKALNCADNIYKIAHQAK